MDSFKFACPVCGQHISCEPDKAGSQMECPTCFQKLVVPQPPASGSLRFILSAAKAQDRPATSVGAAPRPKRAKGQFPYAAVGFCVVFLGAMAVGIIFRHKLFKFKPKPADTPQISQIPTSPPPAALVPVPPLATNWTLDVTNFSIPDTAVFGNINGSDFTNRHASLLGGFFSLRDSDTWPPDLGLTIFFYVRHGEELSGKTFNVVPGQPRRPEVTLRWKDDQQFPYTRRIRKGYAMHLNFGQATNGIMPGRIFICTLDDSNSWAVGTFDAQIRNPPGSGTPRANAR